VRRIARDAGEVARVLRVEQVDLVRDRDELAAQLDDAPV
jgi:hypothetical protein